MSEFDPADPNPNDNPDLPQHGGVKETMFVTVPHIITGTLFLVAIAINFANVVGRYVFAHAISWAEEVLVYLMLWMVFIAAASVAYRGSHLNMDLFYANFPPRFKRVVNLLIAVSFIVCCAFVSYQSFRVVQLHIRTGSVSFASGLPNWVPTLAVFVGFALTAIAVLVRFKNYVTGKFD